MTEPFYLLQINIISARDLSQVSRSMSTYAIGWVIPERKQTTWVDHKGTHCPTWNDRFAFRVTPAFLKSEATTFNIEIYCQAWLRDVLVGSVRVSIASIIPTPNVKGTIRRAVALQICRPSGRPQGILNIAVSVVDGTRRSMPLSGLEQANDEKEREKPESISKVSIRRVKSERTWSIKDNDEGRPSSMHGPSNIRSGPASSIAGFMHRSKNAQYNQVAPPTGSGPGSSIGGSMCNSDVGPSPSVVAAAVAKGLYLPPHSSYRGGRGGKVNDDGESSILQWADEQSEEGVMKKIERWRAEAPNPMHGARHDKRKHRRSKTEGNETNAGRLFRCFGKAYGFEFTIVCGGEHESNNNRRNNNNERHKKMRNNGKKKLYLASSDGDNSPSYQV